MAVMLICEKPDAAKKIAVALASKVENVKSSQNVIYYKFEVNGKLHYAVPAVGHIFGLKDTSKQGWTYPIFDYDWFPTYEIDKDAEYSKRYFEALKEVASKCDEFIIATDLDEEGSVIGYNILRFICKTNKGHRMCFSTLTKEDIKKAYNSMLENVDINRVESGLTRHELDFLWGINLSRALTLSLKNAAKIFKFQILSAGRVQTPMLHFLIEREREIAKFVPTPFWEIYAILDTNPELTLSHIEEKFWDKNKAEEVLAKCKGKEAIVSELTKKAVKKASPNPFDLTSLQTEAYRYFKYSPKKTIEIAQKLYTAGHISYPRTSSQKLPPTIGYHEIITQLGKIKAYASLSSKLLSFKELKPNEGKKEDSAHPAIYPTTEIPNVENLSKDELNLYDLIVRRFMATFGLSKDELNLYDLIVRRFMATFGEPAIRETNTIIFDINGEKFKVTGSRTIEKNWMDFYGKYAKFEEIELPEMKKGEIYQVKKLEKLDKETQPPQRYSQGSIIKELESVNLGTKTTRALILQTLYDRGYIEGTSIKITAIGMKVGEALEKYVPDIVSEELTRNFEEETEKVFEGKIKREEVVNKAKIVLKKISEDFKKNETPLGRELEEALLETKDKQNLLGPCPVCGHKMRIAYSPKTKKYFAGCSGYPDCKKAFPLPSSAKITYEGRECEFCKTSIIKVVRKGKKPFTMCLDPMCKSKENWGKKDKSIKG